MASLVARNGYSMVQLLENVVGSSMVVLYSSVFASTRVNRSTTCKFPDDPRKLIFSLKFVVSTTSVSPSQCATESPSHCLQIGVAVRGARRRLRGGLTGN